MLCVCVLFQLNFHSVIQYLYYIWELDIHIVSYVWATPGRTAIPGRPVARAEQAPGILPVSKNQINIVVALEATYQILN